MHTRSRAGYVRDVVCTCVYDYVVCVCALLSLCLLQLHVLSVRYCCCVSVLGAFVPSHYLFCLGYIVYLLSVCEPVRWCYDRVTDNTLKPDAYCAVCYDSMNSSSLSQLCVR